MIDIVIDIVPVTLIIVAIVLYVYLRFAFGNLVARWMDNAPPWVAAPAGAALVVYCVLVMLGVIESRYLTFRVYVTGIMGVLILVWVTIRALNRRDLR